MVPKPSWLKKDKSHTSIDNSSGQPSPVPSVDNGFQNPSGQQQAQLGQQPSSQQTPLGVAQQQQQYRPQQQQQQQQQQQYPLRTTSTTQSHRLSSHDQLQGYQQQPGPPDPSPGFEQSRPGPQPPVYAPDQPKKSRFSRIAAGLTGGHKEEDNSKQVNKNAIGRRQSTRGRENRPQEYPPPDAPRLNTPSQQYHQRHGSQQQLPTSIEQDEGSPGLDPFLQQDPNTPQVPPKDIQYQQHPQQFAPTHHDQYDRPTHDIVSTEGTYQKQGGVEHYSPDQHQGPQQPQQQSNQPQYQSFPPPIQHPQGSDGYQAFAPQTAPSPRPGNAQQHGQDLAQQQRNFYQYQQQQASQQAQGQSPQDGLPQNTQFQPQQQQFAPSAQSQSQSQKSQDFRQQQVHPVRTASLHQPELQHPQATRGVPQIVQQGQPIDTQQVQQLRPPSQHQPAPPSPLQHQTYQTYDPQQSQQSQVSDSPTSKVSAQTQSQDSMAPSSQSNGRLRKAVDGGQQQSATSSRESSLLQQPTSQGQPQGQPPVSPGVASFGANVVPTASQGQPYRGDKQSGETERATPPPRSATSDMTVEEVEKMQKEHEVLREKYQKVKRYFFEQQTQVHQLQNTLANQRLSLSRTSWDDSEYATRFNRLDGLIAQLSFSIRKDWKSIPPWLHPVVNKTAVEIGKQEMTAVGRAFISHWLVENIFEKYFHPDLEPGFSTQLQMIQLNIRRFAPLCHSSEDEDSLAAKVINWRLATLEGLSDLLRAPQAESNRQKLTETLNEKLIASLQMFLNDPAPPDLAGGVPMIVELAVSIAQHLPLESREVHIEYFPPGHGIVADFMKMESGIPPLTSPIIELDETDRVSLKSVASKLDDNASIGDHDMQGQQVSQAPKEDKKRGLFGGFGASKKPTTAPASLGKRESSLGQGGSQQSLTAPPGSSSGLKEELPPPRVRLAVGVAVQIRGKSVLMKAPVYST